MYVLSCMEIVLDILTLFSPSSSFTKDSSYFGKSCAPRGKTLREESLGDVPQRRASWDLPGEPVVKTWHFQ